MKNKIIGLVVFLMLCMPLIMNGSGSSLKKIKPEVGTDTLDEDLNIMIYKPTGSLGVNLDIKNSGATALNDVEWSFRIKLAITGSGLFISEKIQNGVINQINASEEVTLEFRPFGGELTSPLGLGGLYMNASVKVNDVVIRTQQRAYLFGFFLFMFRDSYMDIKADEAYARYQNNEFDLIIDVVGLDIYNLGHLPGAVNYVWADGTLNQKISELDPALTYLVYCHTDPPSTSSAQALVDADFKHVYRLEGNYRAWKDAGYPVET